MFNFLAISLLNYICKLKHWGQLQEILLAKLKTLNLTLQILKIFSAMLEKPFSTSLTSYFKLVVRPCVACKTIVSSVLNWHECLTLLPNLRLKNGIFTGKRIKKKQFSFNFLKRISTLPHTLTHRCQKTDNSLLEKGLSSEGRGRLYTG